MVQVYTGLVYEGPAICKRIVTGLLGKLEEKGLTQLGAGVGSESQN